MLEDSDNKSFFANDKLIENDSFAKKLLNAANTFYHKTSKKADKMELSNVEQLDEVDEDDTEGLSDEEIEISNWHKQILTALENIVLDIKNENSNSEVWSEDLINKVSNCAISIFQACFPRCQALFAFDNAKSHITYALDVLVATRKQEKMCSTSYFREGIKELWPEKGLKLKEAQELMSQ
ncbi:12655_t:CDS:2 [Gigaspora margarita]|uniref:12655_t:CDS:1 n=1 Tax=Gigaspora margarita TaxID=4874 RepID=A0ABN7VZ17_GIGMA|nr:12655_t:CDS:2 [Gigaspora margarita]